jgi:uncharacterized SAM-binding protein YcdF (DUF218 family)
MMFLLSKLLPLLVLPLGLALLLLVTALIRHRRWPVTGAFALLWVFATPLVADALWRLLEHPHQRRPAAAVLAGRRPRAVVVLGGGRHAAPGPARLSEWNDADRFFGGLDAYHQLRRQGLRPRLIFTGGWWPTQPQLPPEGDVLRAQARELGVPAADLASTGRVRNTAEEAPAVAALLPPASEVVLVTSAFHMARARGLFEGAGLCVLPFPVDFQARGRWAGSVFGDPLRFMPSAEGLAQSTAALREMMGRAVQMKRPRPCGKKKWSQADSNR